MITTFLHPERRRPSPQPRQVDLRRVILAGMALWGLSTLVLVVVGIVSDFSVADNIWISLTGLALGFLALGWEHTNRRRYRAVAETVDIVDDGGTSAATPPHDSDM